MQPPDYLSIADSGLPSYEAAIRLPLSPRILLESSHSSHLCSLPGPSNVISNMGALPYWPPGCLYLNLSFGQEQLLLLQTLLLISRPCHRTCHLSTAPTAGFRFTKYSQNIRQIFTTTPTFCFATNLHLGHGFLEFPQTGKIMQKFGHLSYSAIFPNPNPR